jgi:hypothetical protein
LFDVPLIKSGYAKFGSQLAMSEKFGLNRNTLRKKINDYKDKLDFRLLAKLVLQEGKAPRARGLSAEENPVF